MPAYWAYTMSKGHRLSFRPERSGVEESLAIFVSRDPSTPPTALLRMTTYIHTLRKTALESDPMRFIDAR